MTEAERRKHVQNAEANHRIEGFPPSPEVEEIYAAYIGGEIEAKDLVAEYKKRFSKINLPDQQS